MRKKKRSSPLMPYGAGLIIGYAVLAGISGITALIVLITDMSAAAGISAVFAIAAGSFVSGRIVGKSRRREGIKTGALCGTAFIIPLLILSIIFGKAGTFMMFVKIALSVIFGAAGGVSGVNAKDG